ncbi:hypothetical protein HS088_TW07G00688 [Tripterygium wilfordii]|uniref:Membrane lipoprotein n=1 Tax=Tripterygium wilfordii TaxID=458696 RepID=A0A7J7DFH1_TRIWF|nr:uncharacterized protein LOC120002102 [Tripterygium wilfordii]KAF5745107.1 hypothetical protein HS088_TW07G00688 [Tripterygium wilfordii]
MPAPDPKTGRAFIWLVSCFLFISIAAGGTFLMLYMILPESESTSWLPIAGVFFVCLPWMFWFLTCFYRILSRACGFRVAIGGGGGGGERGGGGGNATQVVTTTGDQPAEVTVEADSLENDGRHVQFGPPVVLGGEDHEAGQQGNDTKMMRHSLSNSSDSSIASHESEMPLALSMAS